METTCSLYYAVVALGTPKKHFLVALNTENGWFWVPCDCLQCAPTSNPIKYGVSLSSLYGCYKDSSQPSIPSSLLISTVRVNHIAAKRDLQRLQPDQLLDEPKRTLQRQHLRQHLPWIERHLPLLRRLPLRQHLLLRHTGLRHLVLGHRRRRSATGESTGLLRVLLLSFFRRFLRVLHLTESCHGAYCLLQVRAEPERRSARHFRPQRRAGARPRGDGRPQRLGSRRTRPGFLLPLLRSRRRRQTRLRRQRRRRATKNSVEHGRQVTRSHRDLQFTPCSSHFGVLCSSFYNLSFTGIAVGNRSTAASFTAIVDSGVAFTYLSDPTYSTLTDSVRHDSATTSIQPRSSMQHSPTSSSLPPQFHAQVRDTPHKPDPNLPFEYCYDVRQVIYFTWISCHVIR